MDCPGLSIIIPAHNEEETLPATLKGIEKQEYSGDLEVIVVDDGSEDQTGELAEEWGATVIRHETGKGHAGALNAGISASKHPYICTLHADCVPRSTDWLTHLMRIAETDENIAVVSSQQVIPDSVIDSFDLGTRLIFYYAGESNRELREEPVEVTRANFKGDLCRKSALEEIGLFDEDAYRTAGADVDVTTKLSLAGYTMIEAPVILEHRHGARGLTITDYLSKKAQYSEAKGVNQRRHGRDYKIQVWNELTKLLLYIGLLTPYRIIFAVVLLAYLGAYLKKTSAVLSGMDYMTAILYTIPADIFCGLAFVKGFLTEKQTL